MNNLYKQAILLLYQDQTNRGMISEPTFSVLLTNPLCGDHVSISGIVNIANIVQDVRFMASGCVLSQAAAAFIAKISKNKTIDELYRINEKYMQTELGITLGPTRLRCVMLSVECLHKGLLISKKEGFNNETCKNS